MAIEAPRMLCTAVEAPRCRRPQGEASELVPRGGAQDPEDHGLQELASEAAPARRTWRTVGLNGEPAELTRTCPPKTREQEDRAGDYDGHDRRGTRPAGEEREMGSGLPFSRGQLRKAPPGNKG